VSIEKHQCKGGDFHTTTDFLDCECGAVIPNVTQLSKAGNDIVFCAGCGTEFAPEDLPDARVEEIVQAVADAADTSKTVPENCVAIGESRMLELEEKESRYDELHEHWLRLIGTKVALCYVLEKWRERIEWAPEAYAPMTRDLILRTDAVLEVKRGPTPATTQPGDGGACSWIVELTVPAACVANGFEITEEVAFHMLASHSDLTGAELKAKVIAGPKQDRIHDLQCGKEEA
jgi:hypothetical protein